MTDDACSDQNIRELCEKLFANTVIEEFRYEVEEVTSP